MTVPQRNKNRNKNEQTISSYRTHVNFIKYYSVLKISDMDIVSIYMMFANKKQPIATTGVGVDAAIASSKTHERNNHKNKSYYLPLTHSLESCHGRRKETETLTTRRCHGMEAWRQSLNAGSRSRVTRLCNFYSVKVHWIKCPFSHFLS